MVRKRFLLLELALDFGYETAIALARRNHIVYASVHYKTELDALNSISKEENLKIYAFKLDILNESDRNLILNYDIDVFISNAAIGDSGSVADIDIDRIVNVFNTNVFCNLHAIQLALSNMIKNKKNGRIVILSSLVRKNPSSIFIALLLF